MLSSNSIEAGSQVASALAGDGIYLDLVDTSPLAVLLGAHGTFSTEVGISTSISGSLYPEADGYARHDAAMNPISLAIGERVAASISYARDTITPVIRDITNAILETKGHIEADDETNIKIVPTRLHPVYEDIVLENILRGIMAGVDMSVSFPQELNRKLSEVGHQEFLKIIKSANDDFNTNIIDLMASTEFTWDGFAFDQALSFSTSDFTSPRLLLNFLFLRGINQDRSDTVTLETLTDNEKVLITKGISKVGRKLQGQIEYYERNISMGRMFFRVNNRIAYVHQGNYAKFMKNGGEVDLIIAAVVTGNTGLNAEGLISNKERLLAELGRYRRAELAKQRTITSGQVTSIASRMLREYIKDSEMEDGQKSEMLVKLGGMAGKWGFIKETEIVTFVRVITCKTLGPNTDALSILNVMEEYMDATPGATLEEALLEAAIDRLASYMASQTVQRSSEHHHNLTKTSPSSYRGPSYGEGY